MTSTGIYSLCVVYPHLTYFKWMAFIHTSCDLETRFLFCILARVSGNIWWERSFSSLYPLSPLISVSFYDPGNGFWSVYTPGAENSPSRLSDAESDKPKIKPLTRHHHHLLRPQHHFGTPAYDIQTEIRNWLVSTHYVACQNNNLFNLFAQSM